jgi:hypothetical protein
MLERLKCIKHIKHIKSATRKVLSTPSVGQLINKRTGETLAHVCRLRRETLEKMTMDTMRSADNKGRTVGSRVFDRATPSLDVRYDWWRKVPSRDKYVIKLIISLTPHLLHDLYIGEVTHEKLTALTAIRDRHPEVYEGMSVRMAMKDDMNTASTLIIELTL